MRKLLAAACSPRAELLDASHVRLENHGAQLISGCRVGCLRGRHHRGLVVRPRGRLDGLKQRNANQPTAPAVLVPPCLKGGARRLRYVAAVSSVHGRRLRSQLRFSNGQRCLKGSDTYVALAEKVLEGRDAGR